MEHDEIRRLARLMEELGLAELEVEDEASRVRLVRAGTTAAPRGTPEESRRAGATDAPDASGEDTDSIPPGLVAIRSPLVGTFWRAPSPDAAPFVSPGDDVDAGTVLCLVEAMKTMNEVVAEAHARVVSVRPENGAAIEYGTILFLVEPLG
ncbi:MAG: acetyl-CoA carboxylase biotin carboxyl carrier protein [Alphaproteobacteria bacterium]